MKIPSIPGFDPAAFEKYLKNTGWLMFGKIMSMLVGFLIARYLGPYAFGDLSFADAFASLFAAVGTLGLDSFIIREILHDPEKRDQILGTSFWMRFVVSLLLVPLSVTSYLIFKDPGTQSSTNLALLIGLCSSASLFKSFNVIDSYFQSQVQAKYVVHVQNVCLVISALVKVLLVTFGLPVIYFGAALVFDGVLLAAGLLLIYEKRKLRLRYWSFDKGRALSLISKSWPLILSAVMISVYMKIDQVMLKEIAGSAEVGVYSSAAKISESWYFIPVAIVSSVFPAIINARNTDTGRYHKRLQNLYDLLVAISLPVAIIVSVFAQDIIDILYGMKYQGAGTMLAIHIWSGIFVFLGSASSQYLLAEGFTMISFVRTAIGAIVNVLLNLWLIPAYGGVGASVATLIAYFVATFFIFFLRSTRKQAVFMLKSLFLVSLLQTLINRK